MASVIFGIITRRLGDVLVFLFFYGTLRSFSGGVHCKSKAGCFCLSMAILLIPIYTSEWIMGIVNTPVLIIIGIMAVVAILILSPVESINKPLDDEERRFYGRVSHCIVALQVCILALQVCILAFLFCLGKKEYFYAGYSSLILVAVFMVIGEILTKRYI